MKLVLLAILCSCSSVASSAPEVGLQPSLVRVSLPLHDAFGSNVFPAKFIAIGNGIVVQIPMIPIGSTIVKLDARVRGSTMAFIGFADQIDGGFQEPALPPGAPSTGAAGQEFQTITLSGINRIVQQFHVYYAGVFLSGGIQPIDVSSIELTYQISDSL